MGNTPQQEAMRARSVLVGDVAFTVEWAGTESIVGRLPKRWWRWWRLSFKDEELFLCRTYYISASREMDLDCGCAYFDLADPRCFDQVVRALVERLDG